MLKLTSKEQLLHYFLNDDIKLSTYDQKFLHNLEYLIAKFHRITTNQHALFEKLISKYSKQFTKAGFDKELLKALPWHTSIVESTPEFTGAQVSLVDDNLIVKVPFNKHFISDFRSTENNPFEWIKNDKRYVSKLATHPLKIVYSILPKYFNTVTYSVEVMELLNQVVPLESEFWSPTYIKRNSNFFIAGINPFIYEHTKDYTLNDDAKTLFELSQYGIKIDKSVTNGDEKKIFASEFNTVVDLDSFPTIIKWLQELGVDIIYFGRGLNGANARKEIVALIQSLNISIGSNSNFHTDKQYQTPVMLRVTDSIDYLPYNPNTRITKYIKLQISRPVNVK